MSIGFQKLKMMGKTEGKRNSMSKSGEFLLGAAEMNPTSIHENVGSIPGIAQWVGDPVAS